MFRSVLRPSSGVSSRTLRNYYVSACLLRRIPVCGGMLSVIYKYLYYSLRNVVIWDVDCYTRGCVAYLYVYTCAVPVGVVSGCVLSSMFCGGCASSESRLGSFTCCSVISWSCWRYIWLYRISQLFIFCPFLHGCISLRVFSAVPYSCQLFKICAAYADVVLLDLM